MSSTALVERLLGSGFAAIDLATLNAKAAMLERTDQKYIVSAAQLAPLLPLLAEQFEALELGRQRRFTYDTCYFDDARRSSYRDHLQGRRQRCKVRIRHYLDVGEAFVEVKLKAQRGSTIKRRRACAPADWLRLDDAGLAHVEGAHQQLYRRALNRQLLPVLQMHYQRSTLVAREGGERLTLDRGLHFVGERGEFRADDSLFIIETKSRYGHGLADALLRQAHLHPLSGCSKYCLGLALTGGVERCNPFLPALRRLTS